ncbi:BTAD domain-containing putative transcriptional regulator [Amycolatopsis mongoliensis]|uniref:BTAD domain-containing putative transcriptional regulator n=1 Tax=Amycolatopsis mongoliensis TaxID=715475 RepID=A0A9Y2JIA3_9PSEU|nr:BTAD domain-containing putative transcriptional regulator [Amycolatopsis sp. 4-36]WIX98224.1 BTAD domain-containing putative transcriptional regulator [Amycolatopsis sp. 4-36]
MVVSPPRPGSGGRADIIAPHLANRSGGRHHGRARRTSPPSGCVRIERIRAWRRVNGMSGTGRKLWIALLGEVQARAGGRELALGAPRQRAVLAMLAIRAGQTVARAELIDGVWGDSAPASVEGSVHTYIHGLRRALSAAGGDVLVRTGAGYRLVLAPGEVDLAVAESRVEEARRVAASGDRSAAADLLAECLALWRGSPLGELPGPFAAAERRRLTEWRFQLVEERADLMLEAGRHREVIPDLGEAVQAEPFRERLRAQLMLALYRSGQRSEALAEFDAARRRFTGELGLDPGAELAELHRRMLRSDPGLDPAAAPRPGVPAPIPAQLPHAVSDFVGRVKELEQLCTWHTAAGGRPPVIFAIEGAGGIGKTSLAVRFARRLADSFPDGQLYLDLRGYDPKRPPLSTAEALGQLLWSLGCTRHHPDPDAQKATYRALLSDKRVLILLDNAVSPQQVRELLPGTSDSLLLVTSRNRLTGLGARDGAHRLSLGLLTEAEALDLLRRVVGGPRVDAEPQEAAELARLCGHLPLALRIAAEKASSGPESSLRELVRNLTAEQDRLDALHIDDDEMSSVRTVFSWSYTSLPGPVARTFRYLGLLNTTNIGVPAAAALLDRPVRETEEMLNTLCDRHLLDGAADHRFRFHDLVRLHAGELAIREEGPEERAAAIHRLLTWYVYSVRSAFLCAIPNYPLFPAGVPEPRRGWQKFDTRESAYAWYEAEAPNIAALTRRAAELGEYEIAWQLPWYMHDHYYSTGQLTEWLELLGIGLSAAEKLEDPEPQARVLNGLGIAHSRIGRNDVAVRHLQRGIDIARKRGHSGQLLRLLTNLASTLREMKNYEQGIAHAQEAWLLAVDIGGHYEISGTLDTLCELYVESKRPAQALECGAVGLEAARAGQIGLIEANLLVNVAHAHRDLGDVTTAAREYEKALKLCTKLRDRYHEALALLGLAELQRRKSRYPESREQAQRALDILVSLDGEEAETAREFLSALDAETGFGPDDRAP